MFSSKWLRATDAENGDLVYTIRDLVEERIGTDGNGEMKWVVYFHEDERGLVLNKTNMTTIAKLHGEETDDWVGKKIALFTTVVEFKDERVKALRVRSKPPKAKAAPAPDSDADDTPF